jgi:asparagine synthetase B (glutamine-hydrolysing)
MPGIIGIASDRQQDPKLETRFAAMAYPLVFTPEQEVEWFRHEWYAACTVGYGESFSFLKKASAYKQGVLLIMDGEIFPEATDVPHELAASAPTIQRAEYCLYLYLQHGPAFAERLNGNFVLAVFDNRDHIIHLYNDRFGSEPLYIWTGRQELAFATSVRSLLKYRDDIGRLYNKDAIAELIVFEKVLGDKTLFPDVCRMVPASHATWDGNRCRIEKYWRLHMGDKPESLRTWKDAAVELNGILERSIARRQADSARTAALVSGGVDSRLLLQFCSPQTIAATFSNKNHPPSIETRLAANVAQILGRKHLLIDREADHYVKVAELAVDVNEGLMTFAGCHSLGLHQQMLQSGIHVILTGLWWDTLFKGYYSVSLPMNACACRDEPSIVKSRRTAWQLANSSPVRPVHEQHLMALALSNEMKERAAVARERVIMELSQSLSEQGEWENLSEYVILRDLQSSAVIGFLRALRTCFLDRSPAYDNDLLMFSAQIPADWKKNGRIVRWALRLANPELSWISDANTGLPAGLCPPWDRVLGSIRKTVRDGARWLSRYSRTVAGYRQPLVGCTIFTHHSSWHDMDGMLRLCRSYRSMVESTIEQLDGTIFDKSMIAELLREDLDVAAPRLKKLFQILVTFGLVDKKWGPRANRNSASGEIGNMKLVDLRNIY